MVSDSALKQARELMDFAHGATDDPRRTRIDLLQVANYIARQARQDDELRDLVSEVSDFLSGQSISTEDLDLAEETGRGSPTALKSVVQGPASYFHAALRLVGLAALRKPSLTNDFEALMTDVPGLTAKVVWLVSPPLLGSLSQPGRDTLGVRRLASERSGRDR